VKYRLETLGSRLRLAREAAGLTQDGAAAALEVTRAWISRVETGEKRPSLARVLQFAELYGATLDALLGVRTHNGARC
jgi:transcriptional regulator with XRE-family HTH domain